MGAVVTPTLPYGAFLFDIATFTHKNNIVDLKRVGVVIVTTVMITGAVNSCATKPIEGHATASLEPMDGLVIWADPWQPSMPVPSIWKLVVHRLIDVKEEYSQYYYGAALIEDTVTAENGEPCFALLGKKDPSGKMSALMYSRHNDAFARQTNPLSKDEFTTWILTNGLDCAAESAKKTP